MIEQRQMRMLLKNFVDVSERFEYHKEETTQNQTFDSVLGPI
jgi:hypothetical protein